MFKTLHDNILYYEGYDFKMTFLSSKKIVMCRSIIKTKRPISPRMTSHSAYVGTWVEILSKFTRISAFLAIILENPCKNKNILAQKLILLEKYLRP